MRLANNQFFGRRVGLVLITGLYAVLCLYKREPPYTLVVDEIHYWSTTLLFSRQWLPDVELLRSYPELNTPLPFLLGGWIIQLFGESIRHLRAYNLLLSFLIVNLFLWLNPKGLRLLLPALAGVFLAPYFLYCSLYFYTDLTTVFWVLLGIVLYQGRQHFGASICLALAICSRQYAIAFPIAIIAHELLSVDWKGWRTPDVWKEKNHLIGYGLAAASLLGWWVFWGSLGPPAEMARQNYGLPRKGIGGFNIGFSLYTMACFGFYYVIPEALFFLRNPYGRFVRNKPAYALLLVGVIGALLWNFPIQQTRTPYFAIPFIDPLDRWLNQAGLTFMLKQIVYGVLAFACAIRFFTTRPDLGAVLVGVHILMMSKTQIAWDKYVMPALVVLWFLTLYQPGRSPGWRSPTSRPLGKPAPRQTPAEE